MGRLVWRLVCGLGESREVPGSAGGRLTFDEAAERYIAAHQAGWRNAKHDYQWRQSLAHYTSPHFGSVDVGAVDTSMVLAALTPIWSTKTETATRVRQRIEAIRDWAKASGLLEGRAGAPRW